jgi:uncharacterized protein (TIRG00374 family)
VQKLSKRFLIGVVLGALLLGWFLYTIEWPAFLDALLGVRVGWVLLSALILLGEFVLRAVRWRILLMPIAPQATLRLLLSATFIGGAVNTLLPARAGDLARPLVAHRGTGVPLTPIITTNVVERVFDLVGLLFILLLALALLPTVSGPEGVLVENLRRYGLLMGGAGMCGMIGLFFLARNKAWFEPRLRALVQRLPERMARVVGRLLGGLMDGLAAMARPRDIASAILVSLALWFNGALSIFVLFQAFGLPLPFGAAAFTTVALALTVVLPQAPGFVGVFHMAIEKTLLLWGMEAAPSKGYAVLLWGVSFLPVTLLGLVALWREGLSMGSLLVRDKAEIAEDGASCNNP